MKVKSRYVQGGTTDLNKKRLGWWERNIDIPRDQVTDVDVVITPAYAGRPDLIAYDYYGHTSLTWIVLQYNDIVDDLTELITGTEITIPSAQRVFFEILTESVRIQEDTL